MEIQEHRHGAVVVLKPLGPLCLNDAEIFRQRMFEVMAKSRGHFVIDVSGVSDFVTDIKIGIRSTFQIP